MPRGRPPIPRTKEQALAVRREQVRKNVQAFRKRKQVQDNSDGTSLEAKEDAYTFVLENLGPLGSGGRSYNYPSEYADIQSTNVQNSNDRTGVTILQEATHQPRQWASYRSTNSILNIPMPVPTSIDGGPVSLQQLSSTVTFAFSPSSATSSLHWTQMLPSLVNRNRTLDLSIQALCMLQVGHLDCDNHIFPQSLLLYNRALKSLQSALTQHGHRFKIEIFAAMVILGVYELLQETTAEGRGWMAHFEGGATYLCMFPSFDMDDVSPQMAFHFLEAICIFDALGSRRQNCCSKSKWWRDTVDQFGGDAYGSLLRMLTSLPGVLEQCDRAMSLTLGAEAIDEWTRLLQLCLRLEDAFLGWLKRTTTGEESDIQPLSNFIAAPASVSGRDVVLETTTFPDLSTARLCLLYWSSVILLYESIIAILRRLQPQSSSSDPTSLTVANVIDITTSPQAYSTTAHLFATMILRSVPFCLEPRHGVVGKGLVLLPIHIARNHLWRCRDKELTERCDEWLERLGQKKLKFGLRVTEKAYHQSRHGMRHS